MAPWKAPVEFLLNFFSLALTVEALWSIFRGKRESSTNDFWRQSLRWCYLRDPTFGLFDTIPVCDTHTHTQTYRQTCAARVKSEKYSSLSSIKPIAVENVGAFSSSTLNPWKNIAWCDGMLVWCSHDIRCRW